MRMGNAALSDFVLCVVSFHEQVLGAHDFINRAKRNPDLIRGYTLLGETLASFASAPVLPLDQSAIAIFDRLRQQKVRIGTMDLRIASIALAHDLIVLTRNGRNFNQVSGLITEDWTT
jgi:tRNA(fMet)-specific endonuclease VapC